MSVLSEQLVSAFVRATNDQPEIENDIRNDPYLYGTVTNVSIDQVTGKRTTSVLFDGASASTPMTASAVEVTVNDRVMCLIKNRQGQVVANMTAPPVGQSKFESYKSGVTAEFAAVRAEYLEADTAVITELHTKYIDTDTISAQYATLNELHTNYFTSDVISGRYATLSELHSGYIDAATIDADYAQIDLANIAQGTITTYMLGNGVVGTTQIADGSITDAKIVSLTANKITAGTINAGVVDVINLNASNITGGTLDGSNINVVNLNAANITTGTLNGLRIANGTITSDQLVTTLSNTISTASTNASTALTNAASASSAASAAQSTANGKNTVFYSTTQPSTSGRKDNDIWFDIAHDSKMYRFSGSAWVGVEFGTDALADDAVDYDKLDSGIGSDISGAVADAAQAASDASAAASSASSASSSASQAASDASAAASSASSASSSASQAASDARDASDYASRSAASASSASSSASSAASSASSASNSASQAAASASSASSSASQAATTAASKAKVFYQTTQPSSSGLNVNDVWFDTTNYNNSSGVRMYYWNGSNWALRRFGSSALRSGCISHSLVDADAITASNIVSGSITAGCLNVANIFGNSAVLAKIWSEDIIATNTITSPILKSADYTVGSEPFSTSGMLIDLTQSKIESPYFGVSPSSGVSLSSGDINGALLKIGSEKLVFYKSLSEPAITIGNAYPSDWVDSYGHGIYIKPIATTGYFHQGEIRAYDTSSTYGQEYIFSLYARGKNGGYSVLYLGAHSSDEISSRIELDAERVVCMGTFVNDSDERLKTNFSSLNAFEDVFLNLEPVSFMWKNTFKTNVQTHFGLKAQQIIRAFTSHGLDCENYGFISKGKDGFYTVSYIELIPLCIHMIQKQQKEIDRLKSLEARVEQQQFMIEQLFNRLPS